MNYDKCVICNKAKTKNSSKRCQKCYGKIHGKSMIGNLFALITGNSIKKHYCIDCKKEINFRSVRCYSCENKRKFKLNIFNNSGVNHPLYGKRHSKKSKKKMSISAGGTGNPYETNKYPEKFYKIRDLIRNRDLCKCKKCNKNKDYRKLDVHHIDYNKENNKMENLITLCQTCHIKTNWNRDYWYAYFTYIMENK